MDRKNKASWWVDKSTLAALRARAAPGEVAEDVLRRLLALPKLVRLRPGRSAYRPGPDGRSDV